MLWMNEGTGRTSAMRIIDANLNRGAEALRVMEEYARFALDDQLLTRAIKDARHRLRRCVAESCADELIRRRDIVGDVGRTTKTKSEGTRTDTQAVVVAACKRLTEALRAIEEYGKTIDGMFAAEVERIRYEGYDLERRLRLTPDAKARFDHVRLYVIITEALCVSDWYETAQAALQGGADCLQLREKQQPDRVLLERARRLATLCRTQGKLFIVNDRPDIAAASGADGVHLGQDDLPVAAARRILPTTAIVGVSSHTIEQFDRAVVDVPDYVAVGPMFASATKPQNLIAGIDTLVAARARTSLPLVAIGGIDEENAAAVASVGPVCLCVCRAVIASADVAGACRRLKTIASGT